MTIELRDLGRQINAAFDKAKKGRQEWIEGTLELASLLLKARRKFASHNKFSEWCKKTCPDLNHQDRAALINMAKDLSFTRSILEQTKRTAWQNIWYYEIKQPSPRLRIMGLYDLAIRIERLAMRHPAYDQAKPVITQACDTLKLMAEKSNNYTATAWPLEEAGA